VDRNTVEGSAGQQAGGPGLAFTQEDINAGRVTYHHGLISSNDLSSPLLEDNKHKTTLAPDAFYFKVWDGHFKPVYQRVHVKIIPLTMFLRNHTAINIKQGTSVSAASAKLDVLKG
jgi:hypothetical protein